MITIITPTGDRTEAFTLTKKWMASQTRQPDQWIVVDDGFTPLPDYLRFGVDYVRREPKQGEGHTLTLNIKEAVKHIKGDKILIFEDDDWYGPTYIETMENLLNDYDLVGEAYARYYNVPAMKYRRIGNNAHASFCQTGFTNKILPIFINCLEGDPYIDARLWSVSGIKKYLIVDTGDTLRLHCSLKGLKGRRGIGSGHNVGARYYNVDIGLQFLIKWVGEENARIYMNHVGQSFISAQLVGVDRKPTPNLVVHRKSTVSPALPLPPPIIPKVDGVTVITCTGDRHKAFELCKKWVKTQTRQPDQWIVVDDGMVPIQSSPDFEYYRRTPDKNDYTHTLCLNLLTALKYVKYERVIIMEDDDWYHSTYIDYMYNLLSKADLVGLGNLLFYYPAICSYIEKKTVRQPAFAQTAFNKKLIPVLESICNSAPKEFELCGKGLVDSHLWKNPLKIVHKEKKIKLLSAIKTVNGKVLPVGTVFTEPFPPSIARKAERNQSAVFIYSDKVSEGKKLIVNCDTFISVGMKGLPGRKGLTTHHNINNNKYKKDINKELLQSIIKKDINYYSEFFS